MKLILILFLTLFANSVFGQNDDDDLPIKIVASGSKYFLKDSSQKRLSSNYDSIRFDNCYYFGYNNKKIDVFTKDKGKNVLKKARAIYYIPSTYRTYQVLINNKIFWLDTSQKILTKDPINYRGMVVCGTVNDYKSRILKQRDSIFYWLATKEPTGDDKTEYKQINITSLSNKNQLAFLNNRNYLEFDGNSFYLDKLDNLTFIETTSNKKINIIRIDIFEKVPTKTLLLGQVDKLYLNTFGNFVGKFYPFQFQKDGLYGYYPFNKTARYNFLNQLDNNFARFILPNGKSGWLDKNGIEYLDE